MIPADDNPALLMHWSDDDRQVTWNETLASLARVEPQQKTHLDRPGVTASSDTKVESIG